MADPDGGAWEALQNLPELLLQLPFQKAVQGGKGLVQQQNPRLRRQNAGQGRPLLLPPGELPGIEARLILQMQKGQQLRRPLTAPPLVHAAQADGHVPLHRHVGKQSVALKEEAHPALLGREVHSRRAVKEDPSVQRNPPPVRPVDTGDAFEGRALPAAGGPQQGQGLARLRHEVHGQMKRSKALLYPGGQGHERPSFRSSRFTASSTAAEIPRFTSTQRKARASCPVRQSW